MRKVKNIPDKFLLTEFADGLVDTRIKLSANDFSPIEYRYLSEIKEKKFGVDYINFSGDFPTAYIKLFSTPISPSDIQVIIEIHRKIWNQGRVLFLLIETPNEIRVYNGFHRPINPNNSNESLSDAELFIARKDVVSDLTKFIEIFGKIALETGKIWKHPDLAKKIVGKEKVNNVLIKNFENTKKKLQKYKIPNDIIHDLLLRSLFILYLEDIGATNAKFYQKYLPDATSYFDILKDTKATYKLFKKLGESFNGDLCPVTSNEKNLIDDVHLKIIIDCFWSRNNNLDQFKLFNWREFNFKYIPIELISEIYEYFLAHEKGETQKSNDGAYYTPHELVEFILNKELPWGTHEDSKFDIKILDPTCGSGIFLVESYNRLIDRWKFSNPERRITFAVLKRLLKKNIFGVEKESEAIKVAAFSLYLTMLDKLEPKTLWQDRRFPYLIYKPNLRKRNKNTQGGNLFNLSSLIDNDAYINIKYDLIVGNPPFKRNSEDEEVKSYLERKKYAPEMVLAFLDRAIRIAPTARVALIANSKILFDNELGYVNFRHFLFNETYVREIYNFSIFRKAPQKDGGKLFAQAVGPIAILFYQAFKPLIESSNILYCAPKTFVRNNLVEGVTIDSYDIKYLPREECSNPKSKIWKISMWGTDRDFELIKKLRHHDTLDDYFDKNKNIWTKGRGLCKSEDEECHVQHLYNNKYLPPKAPDRYYTEEQNFITLLEHKEKEGINYRKFNNNLLFEAPLVIIKKGQKDKRFCASYLDFNCVYTTAIYGFKGDVDTTILKALVAYTNSKFASYFFFLTTSSWGIEREQIMLNEVLEIPAFPFFADEKTVTQLALLVDKIIEKKKNHFKIEQDVSQLENDIDKVIYSALGLTIDEEYCIDNVVNFNLDIFEKGGDSIAFKKTSEPELKLYAEVLSKELNSFLEQDTTMIKASFWITIYTHNFAPFQVIALNFNNKFPLGNIRFEKTSIVLSKLLAKINSYAYSQYSQSVYFRKCIKYYAGNIIYILKPNEKYFWSYSQALNDADELITEILSKD